MTTIFLSRCSSSWMWKKSSKASPGIYSGPRDFNPLTHTGRFTS